MLRFLHAADLHLDSPFRGLDPKQAAQRRSEQRSLLTQMAELANRQDCDLMLLAGDLFDSDNTYPETMEALTAALAQFRGQVFIAPGNHDCLYEGSPYLSAPWPENVHIFTSQKISSVTVAHLGCQVYGAGFIAPDCPSLLEHFHIDDPGLVNLMVLHGDAQTAHSPYNPITREQIAASGLDYLALGHIHQRKIPEQLGKTVYAWPGCAMGRGFDELGQKGVYIGEISSLGVDLKFHPLPGRRYEILEVPCKDDVLADTLALLPADTREHIYRLVFTGEHEGIDTLSLQKALEDRFYALQLKDETRPPVDIWKERDEDTLKGQFLTALYEQYTAADEAQKKVIALAAKLGLYAMEGREEEVLS